MRRVWIAVFCVAGCLVMLSRPEVGAADARQTNRAAAVQLVKEGIALANARKQAEAKAAFSAAAQADKTYGAPYYNLGTLADQRKDYRAASDAYLEYLERTKNGARAERAQARLFLASMKAAEAAAKQGHEELALELFDRALQAAPEAARKGICAVMLSMGARH